jgi:hypothetical protein
MFFEFLLNTCLAIDLILMIKYPFKGKGGLINIYVAVSWLLASALTVSWYLTIEYRGAHGWPLPDLWVCVFAAMIVGSFITVGLFSVVYASKMLCSSGISKQARNIVLLRHVGSIAGFLIGQSYLLLCILPLFNVEPPEWVDKLTLFLFSSQGIYMPLLRLSEPFFFKTVMKNLRNIGKHLCCHEIDVPDKTYPVDTLTSESDIKQEPRNDSV